jgi:hypothetical protein
MMLAKVSNKTIKRLITVLPEANTKLGKLLPQILLNQMAGNSDVPSTKL